MQKQSYSKQGIADDMNTLAVGVGVRAGMEWVGVGKEVVGGVGRGVGGVLWGRGVGIGEGGWDGGGGFGWMRGWGGGWWGGGRGVGCVGWKVGVGGGGSGDWGGGMKFLESAFSG